MRYLKECFKLVNVASIDELGIPYDAKEVNIFTIVVLYTVYRLHALLF